VIDNSGSLDATEQQVKRIFSTLQSEAGFRDSPSSNSSSNSGSNSSSNSGAE
jgi:hypothetical protein